MQLQPEAALNLAPEDPAPFLDLRDIRKAFGGVQALKGVSLSIRRGQIYHLMGENGCGKSTLIKIASGAQRADSGCILIDGHVVEHLTPVGALRAGIETVYQDLSLLPNLTVLENVGLAQQLVSGGGRLARRLSFARLRETAVRGLTAVKLPTSRGFLAMRVDRLPVATRQLIAIARAVASEARLVIMDEPTTALTRREVENLFTVVEGLRMGGVAVLFVTHKLDECKSIGAHAVIMRDGVKVVECDVAGQSTAHLSEWMTGRVLDEAHRRSPARFDAELLRVNSLTRHGSFRDVSFEVRRKEIIGITGLLDSGRNELALSLAGVEPADAGRIMLEGQEVSLARPLDAIEAGIGYVPEDRLSEGLFLERSVRDNIVVAVLCRLRGRLGLVDKRRSDILARETVASLRVATQGVDAPVQSLSGGNQQRVLIGRWLTIGPRLLILHGPTVGVDVGSKETIFRIIQHLSGDGMGVIIISDDLPELLQNCDRVLVMRKGLLAETFAADVLDETRLYRALIAEAPVGVQP